MSMLVIASFLLILINLTTIGGQIASTQRENQSDGAQAMEKEAQFSKLDDLELAASEMMSSVSANSHKIIATGWPSTSPMWPSIDRAEDQLNNNSISNTTEPWFRMMEPFIYADKPRTIDYSLLLNLNATILNILKSRVKPMAVNLSFEYYFDHEQNTTALPVIKIEIDRKEFKYLEPNRSSTSIKPRMWLKFNEQIQITDPTQFEIHDWLKFSLINRQSPSLVAIRRLKIEFLMNSNAQTTTKTTATTPRPQQLSTEPPRATQPAPLPTPGVPIQGGNTFAPAKPVTPTKEDPSSGRPPLSDTSGPPFSQRPNSRPPKVEPPFERPEEFSPSSGPPAGRQQDRFSTTNDFGGGSFSPPASSGNFGDQEALASDPLKTTIKPVGAKKKAGGWTGILGRRRRKRETELLLNNDTNSSIILTCFQRDQCDWKADGGEEIQWSLARMPPSTETVHSGYYYVSNRNNYGDSSSMLHLSLDSTDSATVLDQNSDHCIELAVYITERTYLKMYRLTRANQTGPWLKGNLLLTWAPTIGTESPWRSFLSFTKLTAMQNGQNGWTKEVICYGDFFPNHKECGSGKCAFGFAMEPSDVLSRQLDHKPLSGESLELEVDVAEQVVGVAILQEFARNEPPKEPKQMLQTWIRPEIEPNNSWKFFPSSDFQYHSDNVSLLNLYDDSHYYIVSDWLILSSYLNFEANFTVEFEEKKGDMYANSSSGNDMQAQVILDNGDTHLFSLKITTKLVDSNFNEIYSLMSIHNWTLANNSNYTVLNLSLPVTDRVKGARQGHLRRETDDNLFKLVLEIVLDTQWLTPASFALQNLNGRGAQYRMSLENVSLSDRCSPSPCKNGVCKQNGTGHEDWDCECDNKHRGRHCEFGNWCEISHVTPWTANKHQQQLTLKTAASQQQRQAKFIGENSARVSGKDYCLRKLGSGSKCTDLDLPLNDDLYTDEDKTFICSCQDDFYLSDDSKCKQAHLCNSVVCQAIGMICDESKPFNQTQPCHCNENDDWFPDPTDPLNKCVRRQCFDKQRDCGFDAHICLPTLPGEKPICKCGPKFVLEFDDKGQKYCQSTACVLPSLNDCQQICQPDNGDLQRPYTCACHSGFELDSDGHTCKPKGSLSARSCKPACHSETQICTELGCKCKQGYVGEAEVGERRDGKGGGPSIDYIKSVTCLNVCSLKSGENEEEFRKVKSVCPLGLCDKTNFQCLCSDPESKALINTKYEPIFQNQSTPLSLNTADRERLSPLCHLKRICEPDSEQYKVCRSHGAICVPDYTKATMFDCICPPSTEKRRYGQETIGEFTCEPKCGSLVSECTQKQAICRLVDKDRARCDCRPGFIFNQREQKCYLARYSYAFNLIVVNKYYEPESKFHKLLNMSTTTVAKSDQKKNEPQDGVKLYEYTSDKDGSKATLSNSPDDVLLNEIIPQFHNQGEHSAKSIFITGYNECNITQVLPKSVIEDQYEHDMESFLGYIDQCNERIHQNVRTYHLNSMLSEDVRQSLRQNLKDFNVTTDNSTCFETDLSGMFLNCTVYLQSNEPVQGSLIEYVFNNCDKNGKDPRYCWIKPRLLLKKANGGTNYSQSSNPNRSELNFHQVVGCEINDFCGHEASSVRLDDESSLCSCICKEGSKIEDSKNLESTHGKENPLAVALKETCYPRNYCGGNSTYCLGKVGSICEYDIRTGSRCKCVYPSYEDSDGKCVEVAYTPLNNILIVIIIILAASSAVSIAINLVVCARSKSVFGQSKQYPLNEYPTSRRNNRSTGIPNPAFIND